MSAGVSKSAVEGRSSDLPALLGIVCGLQSEARTLRSFPEMPRIRTGVSAAIPDRAEQAAKDLCAQGVRALVSWGIAGGLVPVLRPGDLVLPTEVLCSRHGRSFAVNQGLVQRAGCLIGSDTLVTGQADKIALAQDTYGLAVDMESHRVAAIAAQHGIPCFVVRVIADPAERALPSVAINALTPDGRPRHGTVLARLLRRPGQLRALLHLASESAQAHRRLEALARTQLSEILNTLLEN